MSLNDLWVAASLTSSSASRTGSISLIVLFQLAKTSSDVPPSAGLMRVLNGLVRRLSGLETSSHTNTWEAGKMPMETCCSSLAQAEVWNSMRTGPGMASNRLGAVGKCKRHP